MLFPDEGRDVNAERLASYIRAQITAGELTDWTVAVLAGDGRDLDFAGMIFRTLERSPLDRSRAAGRYIVKTILAPRDEAIDLDSAEYGRAVQVPIPVDGQGRRRSRSCGRGKACRFHRAPLTIHLEVRL